MKKFLLLFILTIGVIGCSDKEFNMKTTFDKSCTVTLYSGGSAVKIWHSIGVIRVESDCYYFKDRDTGSLVRVSGNVVIEY